VWGKTADSLISTSEGPKPVKPKIKLKTKTCLAEEGDITIRGIITRILIFRPRSLNNKLHKEKYGLKDLQHRTLTKRASLGEKHSRVSR
jgi:hypothetical protein